MGRSRICKYRIEFTYIDFIAKRPAVMTIGLNKKVDAKEWRANFNDSFKDSNSHLATSMSYAGHTRLIHQKTNKVVSEYHPDKFELLD